MGFPKSFPYGGPQEVLLETDYVLLNLNYPLKAYFGQVPICYRHVNIQNRNNPTPVGDADDPPYYIFGFGRANLPPPKVYSKEDDPNGYKAANQRNSYSVARGMFPDVLNIGTEKKGTGYTGSDINDITRSPLGTRPIILKKRGYLVTEGLVNENTYVLAAVQNTYIYPNTPIEEVARLFLRYQNAETESDKLKFIIKTSKRPESQGGTGTSEPIETLEELARLFPKYFALNELQNAVKLLEISGVTDMSDVAPPKYRKYFIDGEWYTVGATYAGLWKTLKDRGLSESAIRRELLDAGFTSEQVDEVRKPPAEDNPIVVAAAVAGTVAGAGTSVGTGGATSANGTKWTGPEGYKLGSIQNITVQRSRNVFFTTEESEVLLRNGGKALSNTRPIMYQVYRAPGSQSPIINQYQFDLAPNEIQYGGFGGEWATVERSGGFPLIDWKSFKLLQISFSFVIAAKAGLGLTADGLEIPVTDQIKQLQSMAQTPFPVLFYGFDDLLMSQFRYDGQGNARGVQFVIQDLSIASTRRNAAMEITRATANITLQEIPIERQQLIGMPRLVHKPTVPEKPVIITEPEYGLGSDSLTTPPNTEVDYSNNNGATN